MLQTNQNLHSYLCYLEPGLEVFRILHLNKHEQYFILDRQKQYIIIEVLITKTWENMASE